MDENSQGDGARPSEDVRGIARWARRYAQNRTLSVVVAMLVFLAGGAVMAGLSVLAAWAYMAGHGVLATVTVVALAVVVAWWIWFSFAGAARLLPRIAERLYRNEGQVTVGVRGEAGCPPSARWVALLFALGLTASVVLGVLGILPLRYMQPISALYCVPFLCYLSVRMGRAGSPFMLLWPALYALHAILLVAGAPIYFPERWEVLNMLVPTVGYGLVAALAGHVYSRVALRRLRALAGPSIRPDGPTQDGRVAS
jgi:hypothetical protein